MIIAEIGLNHLGSIRKAKKLISKLVLTDIDAVTFQVREREWKRIIVSTGTCSEQDIQKFIKKYKNNNIVLNHTQLSYDINDCNLNAISTLKNKFNINISYGSHCANHNVLYMALCYQPSDILFYVKGNKKCKYPDDKHAINIKDVKKISSNLLALKEATGTGIKSKMEIKIK
jgi:sialic acid synthase SpsE